MAALPIVQIEDPEKPGDYLWINASDFDPQRHCRWDEACAARQAAPPVSPLPKPPAPAKKRAR